MDIFYHAMNYPLKGIIDADCCGAFKKKSAEEANQNIKDLAKSNYRALTKTSGSNILREGGILELNRMTGIEAKLDVLMSKMTTQERRSHSTNAVGTQEGREKNCSIDEGLPHEGPYQVKEAQFVGGNRSYNFKPNNNLPTHYTPALRNYQKFFYRSGVHNGPRLMQGQQYAPQCFQGQQQWNNHKVENQGQRRS